MRRRVFYSFHYDNDIHRTFQVRNIQALEDDKTISPNDWEKVKRGGRTAIKNWIDDQLKGRSCTVVLVGEQTASREWVNYEIEASWKRGKGLIGIFIHGLKDLTGSTSAKGRNPFEIHNVGESILGSSKMSSIVKCVAPNGSTSKDRYSWISNHLHSLVEEAIKTRNLYSNWGYQYKSSLF